ncbi:MAG: hypothetical protein ACJ75B_20545 [Flavisolibacter sp.]
MRKVSFVLVVVISFFWTSCTYDADTCSTANTTYSSTVTSIFTSNGCYSCHGTLPSSGAPFSLVGYSNVVAQKSRLIGAISHADGFAPMPQGLPKMSECDISKIKAWVDAGTPDN